MATDTLARPQLMVPDVMYLNVNETWRTAISNVLITGTGSCEFMLTRPNSGDANGGYVSLYKDQISEQGEPVVRQFLDGKNSGKFTISSDKVDFTKNTYVLCYGPFYSASVYEVVTSVLIINGQAFMANSSMCQGISHEIDKVTSYFKFDSNPQGFGRWDGYLIVREGATFGVGNEVGMISIPKNGTTEGVATVPINGNLKRGTTYNVTTSIYSNVRPVAGYTFTTAM